MTPSVVDVQAYLAFSRCDKDGAWTYEQIEATLAAETAAQAATCRVPDPMTPDLAEALCQRVAHSFTIQALATDVSLSLAESALIAAQVSGLDPMVRRLEAPYRKRPIG